MTETIATKGSAFDRIMADPQLASARKKLSAHEIMTIIRHVWAADEERGMRTQTTIYINGTPHRWEDATISHKMVCWLCGLPEHASVTWKATIRERTIGGIIGSGREVSTYNDMKIDCVVTGNA